MMVNELEQRFAQAIERGHLSAEEENDPEMARLWRARKKLEADWPTLDSKPPVNPVNREIPSEIGAIKITRRLGAGGYGEVFEGYHEQLNRKVAVKRALVPALRGDTLDEARSAAKVESPYVVTVYDVLTDIEGGPCIVSEYIDGESMDVWLKEKSLDLPAKLDLFEKIARGVNAAHQKFVLHRDLKPQNVMIDRAGLPHVTDFGLAKDLDDQSEATQTRDSGIRGTPEYMAPEQLRRDAINIDQRVDVFALGVMLYELLTGDRPFDGEDLVETFGNIKKKVPLNPHETPGGSYLGKEKNFRDLSAICMKCVEKQSADRYQSIADLITDLEHYRKREPVSAQPITKLERARRWATRHPARVAVILLVVFCAVGGPIWAIREASYAASQKRLNRTLTKTISELGWYIEHKTADLELRSIWAELSPHLDKGITSLPPPENYKELLINLERERGAVSNVISKYGLPIWFSRPQVDQNELNEALARLEGMRQIIDDGRKIHLTVEDSRDFKKLTNRTFAEFLHTFEDDIRGNQGIVYTLKGEYAVAKKMLERNVEILKDRMHSKFYPDQLQWVPYHDASLTLISLGHCRRLSGDHQAAKDAYLESLSFGFEAAKADGSNARLMQQIWVNYFFIFQLYPELGESELADKIATIEAELGRRGVDLEQLKTELQQLLEGVSAANGQGVEIK